MATQFILSHTSFLDSFGKLLSPLSGVARLSCGKPLSARKKVKRLKNTIKDQDWGDAEDNVVKSTETLQTQMAEMGKCRLCPAQKFTIEPKDLKRSDNNEG